MGLGLGLGLGLGFGRYKTRQAPCGTHVIFKRVRHGARTQPVRGTRAAACPLLTLLTLLTLFTLLTLLTLLTRRLTRTAARVARPRLEGRGGKGQAWRDIGTRSEPPQHKGRSTRASASDASRRWRWRWRCAAAPHAKAHRVPRIAYRVPRIACRAARAALRIATSVAMPRAAAMPPPPFPHTLPARRAPPRRALTQRA